MDKKTNKTYVERFALLPCGGGIHDPGAFGIDQKMMVSSMTRNSSLLEGMQAGVGAFGGPMRPMTPFLISGGKNISSIEVEDMLHSHKDVLLAAVVAQPDNKWNEVPCVIIELRVS